MRLYMIVTVDGDRNFRKVVSCPPNTTTINALVMAQTLRENGYAPHKDGKHLATARMYADTEGEQLVQGVDPLEFAVKTAAENFADNEPDFIRRSTRS